MDEEWKENRTLPMISRNPNQKPSLLYVGVIIIFLILTVLVISFFRSDRDIQEKKEETVVANPKITEQIKDAAAQVLEQDKTIAEYKIENVELSHKNEDEQQVFLLTYSMRPLDPSNYIIVGGGVKGEDGWIREKTKFVTVTEKNFVFSESPE